MSEVSLSWEFSGPQVLLAEQLVHRAGADAGQEHPLRIDPAPLDLLRAHADEHRPRGAHRDQLVRIHRQVVPGERPGVLQIVARHPVIFARRGDVLDQLAEVAAVELGAPAPDDPMKPMANRSS